MWSGSPSGSNRRDERRAQRRRRRRVEEAAEACREVLTEGWQETVAGRASNYVTEITWRRMFRGGRRRCKLLAELASAFLTGKKKAHDLVGSVAGWIASRVGAGEVTRTFAKELASAIPLPQEAKIVAVARGLQVTGILLCVVDGNDLTRCQCFIDLALAESKTVLKRLLVGAMNDWTALADFPPKEPHPAWT